MQCIFTSLHPEVQRIEIFNKGFHVHVHVHVHNSIKPSTYWLYNWCSTILSYIYNTCYSVPTIVRLKSFIIIAEQATNKVNNALRLSVRCRLINGWRIVNDYHLFIAYNPIYYKSPLTIKLLYLIHTFQYAIKLHLLTESFIVENTKKKKPHTHTSYVC